METTAWLKGLPLFKERDVLLAEIDRLGVAIRLEPRITESLKPITIAGRTAGNRFLIHPMEGCDGTLDGRPDKITYHRWRRFAEGGAKIIWGEAVAVLPEARANVRQLWLSDVNEPDFAELVAFARKTHREACGSDDDLLIGFQLTHSGRWSYPRPQIPSHNPVLDEFTKPDALALSDDDLRWIQDAYVAAAIRARDCGVDFIDLKHCHGYLLNEILAARTRFGASVSERLAFARETLGRIKDEVGDDILLATRFNVYDGIPFRDGRPVDVEHPYGWGVGPSGQPDLSEPLEALATLVADGISLINVTAGCPYHNPHIGRPADKPAVDGYEAPEPELLGVSRHFVMTEQVQRAFPAVAVAGTGYSYLRHFAAEAGEANLRDGRVSLVGFGRGAIAYPDFVKDIQHAGAMQKLKTCITVSHCTTLMRSKNNELGQYAAGCVPRDPVYAKLLQEINRKKRES